MAVASIGLWERAQGPAERDQSILPAWPRDSAQTTPNRAGLPEGGTPVGGQRGQGTGSRRSLVKIVQVRRLPDLCLPRPERLAFIRPPQPHRRPTGKSTVCSDAL